MQLKFPVQSEMSLSLPQRPLNPGCILPDTSPEMALLLRATLPPRLSISPWNSIINLCSSAHTFHPSHMAGALHCQEATSRALQSLLMAIAKLAQRSAFEPDHTAEASQGSSLHLWLSTMAVFGDHSAATQCSCGSILRAASLSSHSRYTCMCSSRWDADHPSTSAAEGTQP